MKIKLLFLSLLFFCIQSVKSEDWKDVCGDANISKTYLEGSTDVHTVSTTEMRVYTARGLAWIAGVCNGDISLYDYSNINMPKVTFSGCTVKLMNDIDLGENNRKWTPIGNSESRKFAGSFTGVISSNENYREIKNISVNYDSNKQSVYSGLFGYCSGQDGGKAVFSNICLSGTTVLASLDTTGEYDVVAGGLISSISFTDFKGNVEIDNCINKSTVKSYSKSKSLNSLSCASGIVGEIGILSLGGTVKINNCHNYGNITAETSSDGKAISSCGGIIGYIKTVQLSLWNPGSITVSNCSSNSKIYSYSSGNYAYAAGIAVDISKLNIGVSAACVIINCTASGEVKAVSGDKNYGSIAAGIISNIENNSNKAVEIDSCHVSDIIIEGDTVAIITPDTDSGKGGVSFDKNTSDNVTLIGKQSEDKDSNKPTVKPPLDDKYWSGHFEPFDSGQTGEIGNPYKIKNAGQLAYLAYVVNNKETQRPVGDNDEVKYYNKKDVYFELVSDINLTEYIWVPIGFSKNSFKANFNGNGYKISGLNVLLKESNDSDGYYAIGGLFGESEGVISKTILISPICNISITGSIDVFASGLVGLNSSTGKISECLVEDALIVASRVDDPDDGDDYCCKASVIANVGEDAKDGCLFNNYSTSPTINAEEVDMTNALDAPNGLKVVVIDLSGNQTTMPSDGIVVDGDKVIRLQGNNDYLLYGFKTDAPCLVAEFEGNLYCYYNSVINELELGSRVAQYGDVVTNSVILNDGCSVEKISNIGEIKYYRIPAVWCDGVNGWESIVLPFDANLYKNDVQCIPYIGEAEGTYWLREFDEDASSGNNIIFKPTTPRDGRYIRANTPYIIAMPGQKWDYYGYVYSFNKSSDKLVFLGEGKIESIQGKMALSPVLRATYVDGFMLDSKGEYVVEEDELKELSSAGDFKADVAMENGGSKFEPVSNQFIKPMRAYFNPTLSKSCDYFSVNAKMPSTYIGNIENKTEKISVENGTIIIVSSEVKIINIYAVNGMLVRTVNLIEGSNYINDITPGIYIINNVKVIVD